MLDRFFGRDWIVPGRNMKEFSMVLMRPLLLVSTIRPSRRTLSRLGPCTLFLLMGFGPRVDLEREVVLTRVTVSFVAKVMQMLNISGGSVLPYIGVGTLPCEDLGLTGLRVGVA